MPDITQPTPIPKPATPVAASPTPAQPTADLRLQPRKLPSHVRRFGHPADIRPLIYDNVLREASAVAPITNARYSLSLHDVHYADPDTFSLKEQKEAILGNKTLSRRLRGTWRFSDSVTGNKLEDKTMTIAQVPHMTERGTFILNGTEYTLSHQMRLRPGIFTRIKSNGEAEAHVNVLPGKGASHRYFFEPESSLFKINVGQSNVPLLPILRTMGVTDDQLRKAWGNEIFALNKKHDSQHVIDKLYTRLVRRGDPSAPPETKAKALAAEFAKMEVDPEVIKRTLGKPHTNLTSEAILDTTKKLLAINRREAEPDDRDHLAYQTLLGPEDLIAERVAKDRNTLNNLLWHASAKGNLSNIQPGVFNKSIQAAFLSSGLGQAAEEVNAAELLDHQGRITRLGEGGIASAQAVPAESRTVHPSQLAFVDPVKTPECVPSYCEVMTSNGWKFWPTITKEDKLACLINDKLEFHNPIHVFESDYNGPLYKASTRCLEYVVTPNHRMWVQPYHSPKAAWRFETADKVHNRYMRVQIAHGAYEGTYVPTFTLNDADAYLKRSRGDVSISMEDWCELVGWYMSEGNVNPSSIQISQNKEANPDKYDQILELLNKLPFEWTALSDKKGFVVKDRRLVEYFKPFGYCYDKWIPEEYFGLHVAARQRLYDSLMLGDGRRDRRGRYYAFCTSSIKLAKAFERLAFSLGHSTSISIEPEKRKRKDGTDNFDCNIVQIHKEPTRTIEDNERAVYQNQPPRYSIEQYSGKVYCAEVPGGLLYCRIGDKGGLWFGNSFKAGVDLRSAFGVQKGSDGRMYAPFRDAKSNRIVYRTPQELTDLTVAFPGELVSRKPVVAAMAKGKLSFVPRSQVDLELPSMENTFSPLSNMVPMKAATKGQRVSMGARMLTQALPLQNAEAPHVQSEIPGSFPSRSYENLYGGGMAVVKAPMPGKVIGVTPEEIKVKYADGHTEKHQLYNHHPYNRKTYLHNTPLVEPGDTVKPGQILAKSNYTDHEGTSALGLNARVAYLPYDGLNYEDATVISESMAGRMTSEHMYQHHMDWSGGDVKKGKKTFISIFPGKYDRKTLDTLDDHGVIKPGTIVEMGQPLAIGVKEKERAYNQIHRSGKSPFMDSSITWEHHAPGIVTDVVHGRNNSMIAVKAYMPMQVGDKLSGRYGDKAVVSKIVPDEHMPHDQDGNPFEILVSPMGLISRINPAQAVEAALGKIAAKTGKPYKVSDFGHDNLVQYALDELKKHGMSDTETVTDPKTGRQIPGVLAGNRFFMKLHHVAESKGQGRGAGGGYSSEETPSKGGATGSKRLSLMDSSALLAHGATAVLHDAHVIRGQRNEDYWLKFMAGQTPPNPKVPMVYEKFIHELKGSGINVIRDNDKLHIMALTDTDIQKMTEGRTLQNADTVDWKEGLKPKKGGLFDPGLTGGHGGNKWAKIDLPEPMPNPVMEEPIRRLLGLTENQFLDVLSGRKPLPLNGKSGPDAIHSALKGMNVESEIDKAKAEISSGKKSLRDNAVRRLGYLESLKRLDMKPEQWFVKSVPVIPPIFRQVSLMMSGKGQVIADPNYLYKEVHDASTTLNKLKTQVDDVSQERLNVYNSFKAVTGLGDPIQPKHQEKQVKGLLRHIFGSNAKFGTVQLKLLGASVNLVGRGVIIPNPDMNMDNIGLPENKAWDVYHPFVVRGLVRTGMSGMAALDAVKNKDRAAKEMLLKEMKERPVLVNRYPVLHRYGLMAFMPKLVSGDTIQVSPLITKGFGADFDGDTMQYHVPASEDSRVEALHKMLPSKNLFSAASFKVNYLPNQEYVQGLHAASTSQEGGRKRTFASRQDALNAYKRGEINLGTPVEILKP